MPDASRPRPLRSDVAALYVDPRGHYPNLVADWWDVTRDAVRYNGPTPIVAHPPCGAWGRLSHLYEGGDRDLALRAVSQVRRWGGILEHPAYSKLWGAVPLPLPGDPPDAFGGYTVAVEQCAWGHCCRKPTWLYVVGVAPELVAATTRRGGTPTHWASGSRNAPRGPVPPGIKVASARQRRRTPIAFAEWLLELAATARVRCDR